MDEGRAELCLKIELDAARKAGEEDVVSAVSDIEKAELPDYFGVREECEELKKKHPCFFEKKTKRSK